MGFALAEEARDSGMEVTLISGPVNLPDPDDILVRRVETCLEMKEVIMEYFSTSDLIIMSAAVSDHRPKFPVTAKMNKGEYPASLEMEPNPDILQELGKSKIINPNASRLCRRDKRPPSQGKIKANPKESRLDRR